MKDSKQLLAAISIIVFISIGFWTGYKTAKRGLYPAPQPQRDTVTTVRIDTVVLRPEPVRTYIKDSILIDITKYVHDTVFVEIPREVKVYASDTCYVEVSGFQPELDSLVIYPRYRTVTIHETEIRTEKAPKLSVGLSAGCGFTPVGMQPYIGVGLNYSIISIKSPSHFAR